MPELSSLTREKLVDVQIDLGDGDTVTVRFDRNKVTPAWAARASAAADSDALALPKSLAETIQSWDVTDAGQPFPPTGENVGVLSFGAQRALLSQILKASVPSDAEGKASSATPPTASSPSTETLATPQNGQAPSLLPAPSASPSLP